MYSAQVETTLNFIGDFIDKHGALVFVAVVLVLAFTAVVCGLIWAVIKGMQNDTKLIELSTKRDVEVTEIKKSTNDIKDAFNHSLLASGELKKTVETTAKLVETVQETSKSQRQGFKEVFEQVVESLNQNSDTLGQMGGRVMNNSNRIETEIMVRFDKVDGPLANIQENVAKLVTTMPGGNDELAQLIVDRVMPEILKVVKQALQDCLTLTADMAKELDLTDQKVDDTKQQLSQVEKAQVVAAAETVIGTPAVNEDGKQPQQEPTK